LLIVPVFLALAAFILDGSRKRSDLRVELDRQRQAALEQYIDLIAELLLQGKFDKNNAGYRHSCCVARTRTLSALRSIDRERKAQLIQFLFEAGLISRPATISLNGADLCGANLAHAVLRDVEIRGAYFHDAILRGANLQSADLRGSDFSGADLTGADLMDANLYQAQLKRAQLGGVYLAGAVVDQDDLAKTIQ
jgi:uncharacterized protein YjbI with pentapeptide repeats